MKSIIEVNKELVRISQRNLRVIGAQNFTLFEKDVLDFEFTQQDTIYVIYLYKMSLTTKKFKILNEMPTAKDCMYFFWSSVISAGFG